ncbi:MAG: hypothetical protein RQ824_09985 [bacterium]|nr:hypothetical protein [bacterium]
MKKLFIIFILPLFLSACSTSSTSTKSALPASPMDQCQHQKSILESSLIRANAIEMSAFLEEEMVREIIRPLSGGFDIDTEGCSGYTEAMRDDIKSLLLSRRDEFVSYLVRICATPYDDEHYDASGMSYNQEQYMAAVAALEYLDASADQCYKKSPRRTKRGGALPFP